MTLKEQFDVLIPIEFGGMQDPLLSNCVEVADEFAIGFAEWLQKNDGSASYQELLEIYKKEKGL
jgi:hypothetical protein